MSAPSDHPSPSTETPEPAASALDPLLAELERKRGVDPVVIAPDAVDRARDSLDATIASLKLTPEEEQAMAGELGQLRDLARKLDQATVEIVAFGMVSRGKSSVLNALLGRDLFEVGAVHGTTVRRSSQRVGRRGGRRRRSRRRPPRPGRHPGDRRGRRRDPRGPGPRRRPTRRPRPVRRLRRHAARRDRRPGRAATAPEADHPGLQPDRPLPRRRPPRDPRQARGRAGQGA